MKNSLSTLSTALRHLQTIKGLQFSTWRGWQPFTRSPFSWWWACLHFAAYGWRSTGQLCRVLSTWMDRGGTGHVAWSHSGDEIQGPVRSMHILLSLPWPWLRVHIRNMRHFDTFLNSPLFVYLLSLVSSEQCEHSFLGFSVRSTIPDLSKPLCLHWRLLSPA